MGLQFGVGLPTCREGVAYPVGYVRPSDFTRIAQRAEQLGFDSLWANDHLTTSSWALIRSGQTTISRRRASCTTLWIVRPTSMSR